jgi:uncharacterized protein (TIGR03437 family)
MRRPLMFSILLFVCLSARVHHAQTNPVTNVCAANYSAGTISFDSIVAAFGSQLATATAAAPTTDPGKPPTTLAGTTVRVAGRPAPLFFVSPGQVNYLVPPGLQVSDLDGNGMANVEITAGNGVVSRGQARINRVSPAIFSFDSSGGGLPAALIVRVKADGRQIIEPVAEFLNGRVRANPVDLGRADEIIFLTMFVSGIRNAGDPNNDGNANESIRVLLDDFEIAPSYAGAQPTLAGLDQINVEIPRGFLGRRELRVGIKSLETGITSETQVMLAVPPIADVSWAPSGLGAQSITSLAANDAVVLAASREGIFRSENGGAAWAEAGYSGQPAPQTLTLFSAGGGAFYAGGERSGPWYSGNHGRVWNLDADGIVSAAIIGRTVYAYENYGGLFHAGTEATLFRKGGSTAGGPIRGWIATPFATVAVTALSHSFDRALLGTQGRGVFTANRAGQNWSPGNQGLPADAQVRALAVSEHYVFAALAGGGLYRSTDHGATWSAVTAGLPANATIAALAAYGRNIFAGITGNGIYLSNDYGLSWRVANNGLANLNVQALLATTGKLFAGTSSGVFAGAGLDLPQPLSVKLTQSVTTDEDTPKAISVGATDAQFRYTLASSPRNGALGGSLPNVTYAPRADFNGEDFFTFRVTDGKLLSPPIRVDITINPINDQPKLEINGKLAGIVAGEVVYLEIFSPDVEDGIAPIATSALPTGAFFSQGISTIDPSRFRWTASAPGEYQFSLTATDKNSPPASVTQTVTIRVGDNPEKGAWSPSELPGAEPNRRLSSSLHADASGVYLGAFLTEPAQPLQATLYRSTDNGVTWASFAADLPSFTVAHQIAANNDSLFLTSPDGVWRSPKTAARWTKINHGLPALLNEISSLAVSGEKVAVSPPFGYYLSLDRGENWNRIRDASRVAFHNGALFINGYTSLGIGQGIRFDGILVSTDDGKTWSESANGLQGFKSFNRLRGTEAGLFALTRGAESGLLFRTTDQGASWRQLDPGVPGSAEFSAVVASGDTIFLGTAPYGVYVSRDRGVTWRPANLGLPQFTSITGLAVRGEFLFATTFFSNKVFVRKIANE